MKLTTKGLICQWGRREYLLWGSEIISLTPRLHFGSHSAPYLNKSQEELMHYLMG